jgi:hypothetical protein
MSKQAKTQGPGRPAYQPLYPRTKEWTFDDWAEANGVETDRKSAKYGKGKSCTMLTLRKNMKYDMGIYDEKDEFVRNNPKSVIVLQRGITADPQSKNGLGRRALVYALRARVGSGRTSAAVTPKATTTPKATRKSKKSTGDLTQATQTYEDIKAALTAPVVEVTAVTVPAVTVTPELPVTAPVAETPAPVAETPAPAPEAVAAETAAVAVEATATPVAS